jgi:CHAT domain-containing protein
VAKDLEAAGAQRLLLDLDGPLRYLPFATLHDGHQWLVERYALAVTARGAFAASDDSGTPGKEARAFGVSRAHGGFAPLAAVPGELAGVLDQVKGAGFSGEAFLDEAFTAERLKELTEATAVVHVASHFQFGPGSEDRSALLVGDGSLLSLAAIRAEGVRFDGVRMLTLSACQTGVGGGKDAQGVEVEGLGALALDMGARSVVATLWKVADASTADLMKAFYGRWSTGGPRAESLRDAQLRLIRQQGTARDWSHPFYWGPFILMGAWR